MNIGILKEIKTDENRVAIQPAQVAVLREHGHTVFVESQAGQRSGFSDEEYIHYGAGITEKKKILDTCRLILKVKAPLEKEYSDYHNGHILFTYLHFDENILPEKIRALIESGFLGIAYEWVKEDNRYPLLEPMSRITGYLFSQKAIELCTLHKKILCGSYEKEIPGAKTMIIGIGTIGQSVLKYMSTNRTKITIVDKNPSTINQRMQARFGEEKDYLKEFNINTIVFDNNNPEAAKAKISEELKTTDIVLNCAVRRPDLPKSAFEYLIDRNMVAKMQPNSVICDTTGCDKDLIETCVSTELLEHYDIIDNVIHYNCDHIPSMVGKTASELLSGKTLPYILDLADNDISAIRSNTGLQSGASCYKGFVTHRYSAEKKGLEWRNILELL